MRDALGGAVNIYIIVVFIVFALGYAAFNVNYTKAFRMKDKIISVYEKYDGVCTNQCEQEIIGYADQIGYQPDIIDGWIIKFLPDFNENKINEKLFEYQIPEQILNCPLNLIFTNGIQSILYNCSIASGFYGIIQDEKNFGIKPVIGYAIVVEDKKFI